jgi:hypothetical protein
MSSNKTELAVDVGDITYADLLNAPLKVVNVGLESFSHELKSLGVPVVHVSWTPPANGDPKLAGILSKMGA